MPGTASVARRGDQSNQPSSHPSVQSHLLLPQATILVPPTHMHGTASRLARTNILSLGPIGARSASDKMLMSWRWEARGPIKPGRCRPAGNRRTLRRQCEWLDDLCSAEASDWLLHEGVGRIALLQRPHSPITVPYAGNTRRPFQDDDSCRRGPVETTEDWVCAAVLLARRPRSDLIAAGRGLHSGPRIR